MVRAEAEKENPVVQGLYDLVQATQETKFENVVEKVNMEKSLNTARGTKIEPDSTKPCELIK